MSGRSRNVSIPKAERKPEFVKYQQIETNQGLGDLACLALCLCLCLLLLKRIDQFDGREEADLAAMMLDGLDTEGGRDMCFSCARSADKDNILRSVHELASVQLAHRCFVDFAGGEVEAGEVLVGRKAGDLHVIGDGADLTLGHLGFQ